MKLTTLLSSCLLLLSFVIVNGSSKETSHNEFNDALTKCHVESGGIKQAFENGALPLELAPGIACAYKSLNVFLPNGDINKERLQEGLKHILDDVDKVEEVADLCGVKKSSIEETSVYIFNCILSVKS